MGIAGKVDNEGAFELSEGTIETFGQGLSKVTTIYSALSSVAGESRRFLICVFFLFSIIMLMQLAAGCTVQFTPGDGVCGNGVLEGDEMCDGSDFGGKTCADWSSYEHGELVCTEDCKVDFTMCHTCGDGRLEGPEECDGDNLNGETCESLGGQRGGELKCRADCSFDLTGCGGLCGNGVREEEEECDGEDLNGETCESLGYATGILRCNENCIYDVEDCETVTTPTCGDGVREGSEECDGNDLGGETCQTQGFYAGALFCNDDCMFDTSDCEGYCGDGVINGGEVCDGSNLGGETCKTQGFSAGALGCLSDCSGLDASGCLSDPPVTWITISGGTFVMGSNDAHSNAQPAHSVTVPTFKMSKTQVTVEQYEECVTIGECTAPSTEYGSCNWGDESGYEDHPVNCVTWYQAREFCEWAGGRLPSEAEWEYAARSGGQDITYPWGNDEASCDYAVMYDSGDGCGTDRTWPVCSKVAGNTDQELCDMAGNLWEWMEDDWHESYDDAPEDGSAWVDEPRDPSRVGRGGAFQNSAIGLEVTTRAYGDASDDYFDVGVRCAR